MHQPTSAATLVRPPVHPGHLLDLVLPPTCAGCGTEGAALCAACLGWIDVRLERPAGVPIGLPSDVPDPLLQLEWCTPFAGPVRRALHALKYAGERGAVAPLGAAMARRWARCGAGGEVLVPAPVHRDRARERGYDQAALLAKAAGDHLGLPMVVALERRHATTAQFHLARDARATNVAGAFGPASDPRAVGAVAGRWVVLVDDVATTGATLVACAYALLHQGAVAVSALTMARER